MGRDKAALDPYGTGSMLAIAAGALRAAGAIEVVSVGGDGGLGRSVGAGHLPDRYPDQGPLGGIITALEWSGDDLVAILACDMPFVDAEIVGSLVRAAAEATDCGVALICVDDRPQPLTAVWRPPALGVLQEAFAAGERAPRRMLDRVGHRCVTPDDPAKVVDVDSPADIERYAPTSRRPPSDRTEAQERSHG